MNDWHPGDETEIAPGHNRPPLLYLEPDDIPARLNEDNAEVVERAGSLAAVAERLPDQVTVENLAAVTLCARQLGECITRIAEARKDAKEPFLLGGRAVDGWWHHLSDPLTDVLARIRGRLDAYATAADREERKRQREEAARIAAAAKAEAEAGNKGVAKALRGEAQDIRAEASHGKPADNVRTYVGTGGGITAQARVDFEIKNRQEAVAALWEHIPDDCLQKAVRAWCRAQPAGLKDSLRNKPRFQPLAGVRLFLTISGRVMK